MVSEKFTVNSDAGRMAAARYATEDFARQANLGERDTLRLDLLVEETLGMVKAMLEDFYGQLWFVMKDGACELHFEATGDMDAAKKNELLSMSSTGKNAASRGFMAKLGDMLSAVMSGFGQTLDSYGEQTIHYGIVHMPGAMGANLEMTPIWTLQTYKSDLEQARGESDADEAWDELEKSIVAHLADDIIVGVKGDRVDMVIVKRFN